MEVLSRMNSALLPLGDLRVTGDLWIILSRRQRTGICHLLSSIYHLRLRLSRDSIVGSHSTQVVTFSDRLP